MHFLKRLCGRRGATEEEKVKELETLEESRYNEFEKTKRSRSTALREKYRKEVKERKEFLERMKKSPILDQVAWDRVASFVKEPKDLVNMWGMCEPWRKSVKLRITTGLFSEVFPKLVEGRSLSTNDILNCRRVCKTWRASVDRYMVTQKLWGKGEVGDINVFNVNLPSPRVNVNLYGNVNYEAAKASIIEIESLRIIHEDKGTRPWGTKLLLRFLGNHRNDVHPLRLRWEENLASMKIACAVDTFWKVTHLHFECEHEEQSALFIHNIIILLQTLKDLETLIIRGTRTVVVPALELILETESFPPQKNLRTIVASSLHAIVIWAMLKTYGPQLETLVIDKGSYEIMTMVRNQDLPCLKRFDFASQGYCEPVSFCFLRGQIDSGGLSLKTSLLEKVDLRFIQITNLDQSSLIRSFNKYGMTLNKLQLTLQTTRRETLVFNSSLQLPLMEKLKLTLDGIRLRNIDFLIPSVRLKELNLTEVINWTTKTVSSKQEKTEHIKFSSYRDRLYESNIWRMFPDLKHVRIKLIIKNVDGVLDNNMKRVFLYDRFGYIQFGSGKVSVVTKVNTLPL